MFSFIDYMNMKTNHACSIVAHGKRYLHSSLQRYKIRGPCTVETSWTNLPGSRMHPQLRKRTMQQACKTLWNSDEQNINSLNITENYLRRRRQVWSGQRMYWCRRSQPQQETPRRASWPLSRTAMDTAKSCSYASWNCNYLMDRKQKLFQGPLFHANLLNSSPAPWLVTLSGPNSEAAPYPTDEQPGPACWGQILLH